MRDGYDPSKMWRDAGGLAAAGAGLAGEAAMAALAGLDNLVCLC